MCAVFGIISPKKIPKDQSLSALKKMQQSLYKRGPDGHGQQIVSFENATVFLGHNRLAILGNKQTAQQPMTSPSGRFIVSFNGQIYNFVTLAKELNFKNFSATENSDTEVLVQALDSWGTDALQKFDGMFACAIFDTLEQKLILARDQFGIKPMFWSYNSKDSTLIFASQLKAIIASRLVLPEIDPSSMTTFLNWGTIFSPSTMLKNIHALQPGEKLIFDLQKQTIKQDFIKFLPKNFANNFSHTNLESEFLNNLEISTRTNTEFGIFLSGGMDSSAIACGLHRLGFKNLKTFTLGFSASKHTFDESFFAQELSAKLGFKNFTLQLEAKDLHDKFHEFVEALDQPSLDGFNTFMVSKLAVEHVKVALSGLGGDEIFFGYPQMEQFAWMLKQNKLSQVLLKFGAKTLTSLPWGKKILHRLGLNFLPAFTSNNNLLEAALESRRLFTKSSLNEFKKICLKPNIPALPPSFYFKHETNLIQTNELFAYTAPVLLADSDALAMHSSLEVRVPFLNQSFAAKIFSLEEKLLQGSKHQIKPILALTCENFLPREILHRKKLGFVLPMGAWIQSNFQIEIKNLEKSPWLCPSLAKSTINNFYKKPENWRKIWALLILDSWLKRIFA